MYDTDMANAAASDEGDSFTQTEATISKIPHILPHERVFPIQIGTELFKLSGASISSDAPSYFSQYFTCQIKRAEEHGEDLATAIRTLYIDRDPSTFGDIALHLQGYHVQPRDGTHFVRLFADAQFYSLPKLISQLYEESIFISIGHREFQIPRDIFTDPGNSPNFFSLGFAVFFSGPDDLFPGLEREGLIRPPSIIPPTVPNRSAETFAEILHLLKGYPVRVRSEGHRAELLRDCRYFNFKGLEQRLIPHSLSFNSVRGKHEVAIRLEDILKSGISIVPDLMMASSSTTSTPTPGDAPPPTGWVNYARPFVDDKAAELVVEIGGENTRLHLFSGSGTAAGGGGGMIQARAEFFRDTRARIARLFEVIATKLNLPPTTQPLGLLMAKGGASSQPATPGNTPLSEDLVRVVIEPETSIVLDGKPYTHDEDLLPFLPHHMHGGGGGGGMMMPMSAVSSNGGGAADSPGSSAAGGGGGGGGYHLSAAAAAAAGTTPRKRRRIDSFGHMAGGAGSEEWIVRTGQWRLRIQGSRNGKSSVECVLVAVKLDAMSSEQARNSARGFLTS